MLMDPEQKSTSQKIREGLASVKEIKDYPLFCPCCGADFRKYTQRHNKQQSGAPIAYEAIYECGSTITALWRSLTYISSTCKLNRVNQLTPKFEGEMEFNIDF